VVGGIALLDVVELALLVDVDEGLAVHRLLEPGAPDLARLEDRDGEDRARRTAAVDEWKKDLGPSRDLARFSESRQQEVEVDQSCPGPPGRECVLDHVIPMKARPPEPSAQHVLRPDIVAWEDLEPSEPSEENVLGRPASDAS